jgi:formamidopyrimidine-DNA glycosylase
VIILPELPEVETVRLTLDPLVRHQRITDIEITKPKMIRKQSESVFASRALQATFTQADRRGKFLILHLEKEHIPYRMIIHLGMTGAVFCVSSAHEVPEKYRKHIHVTFSLANGMYFVFSDIRTFGGIRIFTDEEFGQKKLNASILNMGPEVFDKNKISQFLTNLQKHEHKGIKSILLDQNVIAGIGNIYDCEVLHICGIHPETKVTSLTSSQRESLFHETKKIFELSISLGGSSISDYVDAHGKKGSFQEHFRIYNQKNCRICGTESKNVKIDGRSSFYCPVCQPSV